MGEGVPGAMGGVLSTLAKSKIYIFQTRKFSKIFKNPCKIYNFLKILNEILLCFENFLKFYRNFRENLENFGNMHL